MLFKQLHGQNLPKFQASVALAPLIPLTGERYLHLNFRDSVRVLRLTVTTADITL